ncbi:DUF6544 family protein [Saccharicrinis sp. GN24d3]|uniref:DUF6544 family protein n=1 Tax=Saccharicrinis sp. GN24d3 TaxID=3458416 RepID=UPI00403509AC
MKLIFSTIIILHGAIHLLGFLKAFEISYLPQFSCNFSKLSGMFWLLATILLFISGIGFIKKENWWSWLAIVAVVISTVLIITVWKDAKFGMIANLIILIVAVVSMQTDRFNNKTETEVAQILEHTKTINITKVSEAEISGLPEPVKRWLEVSGVVGKEKIHAVWLKQKAKMKMKPEQENWNDATAEQYFTVQNPAFVWKVKMKISPFIKIAGRDKFINGKGEMQIKMFSLLNIVNEKGTKMDEGTLQRYLGEIVWFPSAALSPFITWEAIDSHSAKATIDYKGTKGAGTFHFNENGDFIRYSALRYKGNEPDAERVEWVIDVKEHAVMNGIKIPVKMTATWKLDEGDWTWLDLEITDIRYNSTFRQTPLLKQQRG